MVKVKEETEMATEAKPSSAASSTTTTTSTISNNINSSATGTYSRKGRHHHHHHHHHFCTFPQPITTETANISLNGATPARFCFGPGFEPQAIYSAGPSRVQGQNNSEHVVLFHVHPGVTVSLQIGDNLEVLTGPVTVPMVSTNSSPPIAMPVQVPPGHIVQQIVDESGTLRHVILSAQHAAAGLLPISSHNAPHYGAAPPNGTNPPPQTFPFPQGMPPNYPAQHPHFQSNISPGVHPIPTHPTGHSPPPLYCKDERTQRQYLKLKKKYLEKQQKGDSIGGRKELVNGIKRVKDKGMNSVGTSEDGEESSSLQDEDDSAHIIADMLSSVQAPKVSELTSRSALLQWAAPLRLSEASSNDSHELDIAENELRYEVLLSDKSKEMKYKSIYNGPSLSCRIQDLRPGLEYSVCLQVHLDELQGSASDPLKFTTPSCEPDQPQAPKLLSRTKNTLQLRWSATNSNGSPILHYILEYDEGKGGDFVELHKSRGNQYTLQKLTPATTYRFRLLAVNEIGRSSYSELVAYDTSDNAPTQPKPPQLTRAEIHQLHLSWLRRSCDKEFTLEMKNPHDSYGFLPVYNGPDTEHTCYELQSFTNYSFKLRSKNDGGRSDWSEEVTFQTAPDRPQRPSKPVVKGKIHAHTFRLKWEPPSDTGGAQITKYILEVNSGSGYTTLYSGADTEATCDKLTPGTTYQLRVCCESLGGRSNYSDPCTVTTDAICPGQCPLLRLHGKAKATSLSLRITEPDYNGGAPVLEYEVEMQSPDNSARLVHKSKETDFQVTDLQPGCEYIFTVRAINRVGAGAWSEPVTITSGAAPPDAPAIPTLTCKSPFQILAEWTEPQSNGGTILDYRLEMSTNDNHDNYACVYQGCALSSDVKNLTPFSTYFFRIQASNSAGYGSYSPIAATITPAAAPGPIQNTRYTSTPHSVRLSWNEAPSNGSPVTHYVLEVADRVIETEGPECEYIIDNLEPETHYRLKVRAVNAIGSGPSSSTIRVATKKLPPIAPKLECVGTGHNYLKLKWGEGKNSEYTEYCVEMENNRTRDYQIIFRGTQYTYKVNKLQESTAYRFRICASNDAGEGDYSDVYQFMTNIAPPAAVKPPKVLEVDRKSCVLEWLPSKCNSNDPIEYCVQLTRLKLQQFKEVCRGPDTKCSLDHLEAGVEYSVRVYPIRKTQNGELVGPFSATTNFATLALENVPPPQSGQIGTPTHKHKSKNPLVGMLAALRPQDKAKTAAFEAGMSAVAIMATGVIIAIIIWNLYSLM